jgi:hypothetical protein
VADSWNGTFLHSRRYLSYADERFDDASLLITDLRGALLGIFPAAVHPTDPLMIESHPAVGYGGIVHNGSLRGARMLEALEAVADRYYHDGKGSLRYKPVPGIYHPVPSADDLYALFRLGATRSRCDLASVIDLAKRPPPSKRRVRSLRKAERAGVQLRRGSKELEPVWDVLTERLALKHQSEPLHTLVQMTRLQLLFPARIECISAVLEERTVAGVILFRVGNVNHAQYIAADDRGYEASALDLIFDRLIREASADGARFFSFGNSTLYGGRIFNQNLFQFKSEFGAGTAVHDSYDLALT